MSSTYSASVGRSARYRVPLEVRTQEPSGCPMMASWVTQPRSEWYVSPLRNSSRCRRPRWSISRTCSPSWNLSSATGLGIREEQGDQETGQRHDRGDAEGRREPPVIGHPAQRARADAARADRETHDEPGGHARMLGQIGLAEHYRYREGGDEHEAQQGEEHEHERAAGHEQEAH